MEFRLEILNSYSAVEFFFRFKCDFFQLFENFETDSDAKKNLFF